MSLSGKLSLSRPKTSFSSSLCNQHRKSPLSHTLLLLKRHPPRFLQLACHASLQLLCYPNNGLQNPPSILPQVSPLDSSSKSNNWFYDHQPRDDTWPYGTVTLGKTGCLREKAPNGGLQYPPSFIIACNVHFWSDGVTFMDGGCMYSPCDLFKWGQKGKFATKTNPLQPSLLPCCLSSSSFRSSYWISKL